MDDLLFPIHHGVLFYPGYDVLPPFVVYRADRMDATTFATTEIALKRRMRTLFETSAIPFRRQTGGIT
jgi:NAD(P)H dehydrogenase (quinone)